MNAAIGAAAMILSAAVACTGITFWIIGRGVFWLMLGTGAALNGLGLYVSFHGHTWPAIALMTTGLLLGYIAHRKDQQWTP